IYCDFFFSDPTGVYFDTQSKTVMAQGGSYENMKEKISAVRAIVPNKSNNEIVLVLQHFDNSVDRAVQAFMEGNASEVLKEWTVTGKKKNKKKKPKPMPQAEVPGNQTEPSDPVSLDGEQSTASSEKGGINGYHINGSGNDSESVDSLCEHLDTLSVGDRELEPLESATPETPDTTASELESSKPSPDLRSQPSPPQNSHHSHSSQQHRNANKSRVQNSSNSRSAATSLDLQMLDDMFLSSGGSKKLEILQGSTIDKSVKDLQRCIVSLTRYRIVIKEEMDASIKKMKRTFAELQSCLMDREVALLTEMDKVKAEAMQILDSRQKKAEELKRLTDGALRMSEQQLSELRADIKHFVSERKYDEDLGKAARFTCDLESLMNSVQSFGEVSHPKNSYSNRSRCSSVSPTALTSVSDTSDPAAASNPNHTTATTNSKKPIATGEIPAIVANPPFQPGQPRRQVFQGNRRPDHGYRPQGQRQNDASNPGRSYEKNYRNGPRYQSNNRYQNNQSRHQGYLRDQRHNQASVSNGTATSTGVNPPAHSEANGLPQRKPRPERSEETST
uniref:Spermatosis associated serine rich 2 n=1 Tax=Latimeria chalumnae TaxID=7897 RepID=H3BIF0_LATCH